jgi:glycosidase
MVRGWLARGVDGFRLDVFNVFLKDPELRSNPVRPGPTAWSRQVHVNDRDQPDLPDLIGRFRDIVDAEPGRMSVGELFDETIQTAAGLTTARHLVFDWELVGADWTAPSLHAAVAAKEAAFGADRWPTAVFSNHDQPRHVSRLAAPLDTAGRDAVARASAVLLLTVRGTPFLYYGEELGLTDVEIPPDESVDPPAARVGPDFHWWDRSRCRVPMPWSTGTGAGFTTGQPWLRMAPDVATRNVQVERTDPRSILSFYRRLIALRAATPALQVGSLRLQPGLDVGVVAYTRETDDQVVLVAINPTGDSVTWRLPDAPGIHGWHVALSTMATDATAVPTAPGSPMVLAPNEAVILEGIR